MQTFIVSRDQRVSVSSLVKVNKEFEQLHSRVCFGSGLRECSLLCLLEPKGAALPEAEEGAGSPESGVHFLFLIEL